MTKLNTRLEQQIYLELLTNPEGLHTREMVRRFYGENVEGGKLVTTLQSLRKEKLVVSNKVKDVGMRLKTVNKINFSGLVKHLNEEYSDEHKLTPEEIDKLAVVLSSVDWSSFLSTSDRMNSLGKLYEGKQLDIVNYLNILLSVAATYCINGVLKKMKQKLREVGGNKEQLKIFDKMDNDLPHTLLKKLAAFPITQIVSG